jgi:hypothetical protein
MMSGKAKIESLTNSWYGFAVFSAIFSVFENGIGVFSIGGAVIGLIVSWILTYFIGRALVKKSGFTRGILLLLNGLFLVLGTLAVGKTTWMFVQTFQFSLLAAIAFTSVSTWMYGKSFRVLMDGSVKTYFNK